MQSKEKVLLCATLKLFIKIATEEQPGVLRTARNGRANNPTESYLPCPACLVWICDSALSKHKKTCPCRDSSAKKPLKKGEKPKVNPKNDLRDKCSIKHSKKRKGGQN